MLYDDSGGSAELYDASTSGPKKNTAHLQSHTHSSESVIGNSYRRSSR